MENQSSGGFRRIPAEIQNSGGNPADSGGNPSPGPQKFNKSRFDTNLTFLKFNKIC
jgi:hypothetical protein